jgi:hypothetical protein
MKITLRQKIKAEKNIKAIHWNSKSNSLITIMQNDLEVSFILYSMDTSTVEKQQRLKIFDNKQEVLYCSLSDNKNLLLVIFQKKAILYSITEEVLVNEIVNNNEDYSSFLGGGFLNSDIVYLKSEFIHQTSVDWCYWNYKLNEFKIYPLERHLEYGRAAILHPSKNLIGSCWSAHSCGFLIHNAIPNGDSLYFFDFKDNCIQHWEYESYAPSFNLHGDKFAFVANEYASSHANCERLCIYDIDSNKELVKLQLPDVYDERFFHSYYVANDSYILLLSNKRLISVSTSYPYQINNLIEQNITLFDCNNEKSKFSIVVNNELLIYDITTNITLETFSQAKAENIAESFISKNVGYLAKAEG